MIDWLNCFASRSRIFHSYRSPTIVGEGLHKLVFCSVFPAFEQEGTFIVPYLQWHGTSVTRSHPKDRPRGPPEVLRTNYPDQSRRWLSRLSRACASHAEGWVIECQPRQTWVVKTGSDSSTAKQSATVSMSVTGLRIGRKTPNKQINKQKINLKKTRIPPPPKSFFPRLCISSRCALVSNKITVIPGQNRILIFYGVFKNHRRSRTN